MIRDVVNLKWTGTKMYFYSNIYIFLNVVKRTPKENAP